MAVTTTPISLLENWSTEHPDWSDERVVRAIARRLVDEGEVEPPVDVQLLASLCGIVDIESRPTGPAGMLVKRDRGWIASVLASDGPERKRFTILHEGGHTFLSGFGRETQHRCKGPRTRDEVLCDIAAAEMLLPAAFFGPDVDEAGFSMHGVEDLSGLYQASIQATALRTVDMSSNPAILLVLSERHKPSERGREASCEPKVRLDWAHRNGSWPYPLRDKSIAENSPLASTSFMPKDTEVASVDELFAEPVGEIELSAAWYGDSLLALARQPQRSVRSS